MQGTHVSRDVYHPSELRVATKATQVSEHCKGGHRGPQVLHVQPLVERWMAE